MDYIFEVLDKTGRAIRLTKKQWSHIRIDHPNVESCDEISESIKRPDKVIHDDSISDRQEIKIK